MGIFFVVAVLLAIVGTLAWLWSIRINPQVDAAEQQALAQEQVNTYRLRLKELEHEYQLEAFDQQEYQGAVKDLKRQVLHDLRLATQTDTQAKTHLLLPGIGFLLLFVAAFYYVNGESSKLVNWQEAKLSLPNIEQRLLEKGGESLLPQELQQYALALRTQLHDKDDDVLGWAKFARVAMAIEDFESAMLAFERAYRVDPRRPEVLLGYSQILLMTGESTDMRKAALLLSELLKQQPNNIDALIMVAYIAEQHGDMDKARMSWRVLQQGLPENDPRLAYVNQKLAGANATIGAAASQTNSAATAQGAGKALNVKLNVSAELREKMPQQGTLFVYAKSVGGRPMPAAVVKLSQFNFPMTVELSDANAMLQDYKLSSLENAVIWARVSKDGDIAVSTGELQGQSPEFVVKDTESVSVVIDQLL